MTGEKPRHIGRGFQVPLGVGLKAETSFGDGAFLADCGKHILQGALMGDVVEHAISGDEGSPSFLPKLRKRRDAGAIITPIRVPRRQIEARLRPKCLPDAPQLRLETCRPFFSRWQNDENKSGGVSGDIVEMKDALALLGATLAEREKPA